MCIWPRDLTSRHVFFGSAFLYSVAVTLEVGSLASREATVRTGRNDSRVTKIKEMVNYDSIKVGLEVEFMRENQIFHGIVRYKGGIMGYEGLWVGVEASEPIGEFDGRINGRTYFNCSNKYGLLLTADELRLRRHLKKFKTNPIYKSVNSDCEELLFKKSKSKDYVVCVTEDYLKRAKSSFENTAYDEIFRSMPRHTTHETLVFVPPKKKIANKLDIENGFQPICSVPKEFMPENELKIYTKLNWSYRNVKLPSHSKLNNTFDNFNKNRSNYIGS